MFLLGLIKVVLIDIGSLNFIVLRLLDVNKVFGFLNGYFWVVYIWCFLILVVIIVLFFILEVINGIKLVGCIVFL